MSLILEALKKLDKEKQVEERGFLVMAPATWPTRGSQRPLLALGLIVVCLVAAATLAVRLWPSSPRVTRDAPRVEPSAGVATEASTGPASPAPRESPAVPPVTGAGARREPRPTPPPAAGTMAQTRPGSALRLQAISQKDGRPVAVLNERLVREGDMFDGVRVVRIGEDEVEVEIAGRRHVVRF